uniref:ORF67a n=1 Tax=Pinus koraiensis TaxID=88728 RepID=Q85X71_PINKO|nr:ORF67a [Pinus koraiensis]AAO73991.1 ORF67a [Pinus koraiensis]
MTYFHKYLINIWLIQKIRGKKDHLENKEKISLLLSNLFSRVIRRNNFVICNNHTIVWYSSIHIWYKD